MTDDQDADGRPARAASAGRDVRGWVRHVVRGPPDRDDGVWAAGASARREADRRRRVLPLLDPQRAREALLLPVAVVPWAGTAALLRVTGQRDWGLPLVVAAVFAVPLLVLAPHRAAGLLAVAYVPVTAVTVLTEDIVSAVAAGAVVCVALTRGAALARAAVDRLDGWRHRHAMPSPARTERGTQADRWDRGAAGEEATARLLDRLPSGWTCFHDVAVPGRPENVDHLAFGPAGLWLLDSKAYAGRWTADPDDGSWTYGGKPFERTLSIVRWETALIAAALGHPLQPVIVVHGSRPPLSPAEFPADSTGPPVLVVAAADLLPVLNAGRGGALSADGVALLVRRARRRLSQATGGPARPHHPRGAAPPAVAAPDDERGAPPPAPVLTSELGAGPEPTPQMPAAGPPPPLPADKADLVPPVGCAVLALTDDGLLTGLVVVGPPTPTGSGTQLVPLALPDDPPGYVRVGLPPDRLLAVSD